MRILSSRATTFILSSFFLVPWLASAEDCKKKYDPLIRAVDQGDIESIRANVLPDCINYFPYRHSPTPLMAAIRARQLVSFKTLLELGASPNQGAWNSNFERLDDGFCYGNIVHAIPEYIDDPDMTTWLQTFKNSGGDISSPQHVGFYCSGEKASPALFRALEKQARKGATYLLENHAYVSGMELFTSSFRTKKVDLDLARRVIAAGARINVRSMAFHGSTPLHIAQDPDYVEFLVNAGADINAPDKLTQENRVGLPPLGKLDPVKQWPLYKKFVELGADLSLNHSVYISSNIASALLWRLGNWPRGSEQDFFYDRLVWILSVRPDFPVNTVQSTSGISLLMALSGGYQGHVLELVQEFVRRGADLNHRDLSGLSVLSYWKRYAWKDEEHAEAIRWLEAAGARD